MNLSPQNISATFERPKEPISERFVYEHNLDPYELDLLKRDPEYVKALKRHMARALAETIVEKCQLFDPPNFYDLRRGKPICMEVVINDRGAYENMLPVARQQAKREGLAEGVQRTLDNLPHGIDPSRVWE